MTHYPRVCFGSSGAFAVIGTLDQWSRMAEAMSVTCYPKGKPGCKFHGARMLNPEVFSSFPFASADSTNIARNIGIDRRWSGSHAPAGKDARARLVRERIEDYATRE